MQKELVIWKEKFEDYLLGHPCGDGSHDIGHFKRVWKLANELSSEKG